MARRVTLIGRVARTGLTRGLLGRSRAWLVTGLAATTVRIVHRVVRESPDTVFSEELGPGERVEIRVLPPERR
jgi:hypothetical protein